MNPGVVSIVGPYFCESAYSCWAKIVFLVQLIKSRCPSPNLKQLKGSHVVATSHFTPSFASGFHIVILASLRYKNNTCLQQSYCCDGVREGVYQKSIFLGLSPKLWVGFYGIYDHSKHIMFHVLERKKGKFSRKS